MAKRKVKRRLILRVWWIPDAMSEGQMEEFELVGKRSFSVEAQDGMLYVECVGGRIVFVPLPLVRKVELVERAVLSDVVLKLTRAGRIVVVRKGKAMRDGGAA